MLPVEEAIQITMIFFFFAKFHMPDENLATWMSLIIRGREPTYQKKEKKT